MKTHKEPGICFGSRPGHIGHSHARADFADIVLDIHGFDQCPMEVWRISEPPTHKTAELLQKSATEQLEHALH